MAQFSIALVGNPNCGKTALFNLLTGARQKVANYAGVTVEKKSGVLNFSNGQSLEVIDLPGTYSLHAQSPDEQVTLEVLEGKRKETPAPQAILAVMDATNLRMNLRLILELKALKRPMMVALNMVDAAKSQGLEIDIRKLSEMLGCPVVETVAVKRNGHAQLVKELEGWVAQNRIINPPSAQSDSAAPQSTSELQQQVRAILAAVIVKQPISNRIQHGLDRVLMHPFWGIVILLVILFVIFQAVFSWANWPKDQMQAGVDWITAYVSSHMADGYLRSLLTDGILSGVGTVITFLPQILILFFFILVLEDSGYLPRAAFLLDRLMGSVGLSGRAFIPLLSSFACAIPGVMAARSIPNRRDRLITIMLAPLMTCSARLPVYALIIGAFIPDRNIAGWINLQGLTLFMLYMVGVVSALVIAYALKLTVLKSNYQPLMLELPPYRLPLWRSVLLGLKERAIIFLRRVTGIILALTIVLWVLSVFPSAPAGATEPAIYYSFAGMIGRFLEYIFAPIGFNWQISVALVPGMAAREVAVSALGTVYSLGGNGDAVANQLGPILSHAWSLATGFSLLTWYIFSPQCISTLAVVAKETGKSRYAWIMAGYMFVLAYVASFIVYHLVLWLT